MRAKEIKNNNYEAESLEMKILISQLLEG